MRVNKQTPRKLQDSAVERPVNKAVHAGAAFFTAVSGGNWQKPWMVQVVRLAKTCTMLLA